MSATATKIEYLTSIGIVGFRGIASGTLEKLTPLTILVGPNGCGKTTILEALQLGTSRLPQEVLQQCIADRGGREARWLIHNTEHRAIIEVRTSKSTPIVTILQQSPANANQLQIVTEYQGRSLNSQRDPSIEILPAALVDAQVTKSSNNTYLQNLYTKAVELGRRSFAQEIVTTVIPGARGIEILTEFSNPIIHIVFDDGSVPLSLVGDGIQRVLRIALELASRQSGTVLLEEPEVFQHPRSIRQTAKILRLSTRRGMQVILSTHSIELIDAILDEADPIDLEQLSIYRLRLEKGQLHTSRLDGNDAKFARKQIEDDLR